MLSAMEESRISALLSGLVIFYLEKQERYKASETPPQSEANNPTRTSRVLQSLKVGHFNDNGTGKGL